MLAIRLQRTGRKGHAQFRVVVQDARLTPTSGRIVASLGNYDPHTKQVTLTRDKAEFYLSHGAQPSPRVVRILTAEGVKMPDWVVQASEKTKNIKNTEKLRHNRPANAAEPVPKADEPAEAADAPAEAPASEEVAEAAPTEESTPDTDSPEESEKA